MGTLAASTAGTAAITGTFGVIGMSHAGSRTAAWVGAVTDFGYWDIAEVAGRCVGCGFVGYYVLLIGSVGLGLGLGFTLGYLLGHRVSTGVQGHAGGDFIKGGRLSLQAQGAQRVNMADRPLHVWF